MKTCNDLNLAKWSFMPVATSQVASCKLRAATSCSTLSHQNRVALLANTRSPFAAPVFVLGVVVPLAQLESGLQTCAAASWMVPKLLCIHHPKLLKRFAEQAHVSTPCLRWHRLPPRSQARAGYRCLLPCAVPRNRKFTGFVRPRARPVRVPRSSILGRPFSSCASVGGPAR